MQRQICLKIMIQIHLMPNDCAKILEKVRGSIGKKTI